MLVLTHALSPATLELRRWVRQWWSGYMWRRCWDTGWWRGDRSEMDEHGQHSTTRNKQTRTHTSTLWQSIDATSCSIVHSFTILQNTLQAQTRRYLRLKANPSSERTVLRSSGLMAFRATSLSRRREAAWDLDGAGLCVLVRYLCSSSWAVCGLGGCGGSGDRRLGWLLGRVRVQT